MSSLCLRQSPSFPRLGTLVLILSLVFSSSIVCAQDISAEIARHQEKFDKLENEFETSLKRILSSPGAYAAQEVAYTQLDYVADRLASANREFTVLITLLTLADLVTEKWAILAAKRTIDRQKDYMIKSITRSAAFIEKGLHRARDQETTRLLLEARDLMQVSVEFVRRLQSPEPTR